MLDCAFNHHILTFRLRIITFLKKTRISYLHYAILNDAPTVATSLVKYAFYLKQEARDFPDLTPLYLALTNPYEHHQDLDKSLLIASSYALPKTCEYLLRSGACSNNPSNYGLGAMVPRGQKTGAMA
jgi:hypothetical protein